MLTDKYDFSQIAPYEGESFNEAIGRLSLYEPLLDNFVEVISRHGHSHRELSKAKSMLKSRLAQVSNVQDFQKKVIVDVFLDIIEHSSIDHFTFGGMENLDPSQRYIFISNHRDIILDAALLDLALDRSGHQMCDMVVGDNLQVNQFVTDLFKATGAITIHRSVTAPSELKDELTRLSHFISHCVCEKGRSVWIAQKSGRSKDGLDQTSAAIVKMLYLASREEKLSFSEFLSTVRIVPVSVSYQYDPCDVTKSQQEIRKLKEHGLYNVYHKKKYEDVIDMVRGLRMDKGDVHIQVGKPLGPEIADVSGAVAEIDRQIHTNYKLFDTNWFCYDLLNGNKDNRNMYKSFDGKSFLKHYQGFSEDVRQHVLEEYANPVRSMLSDREKTL